MLGLFKKKADAREALYRDVASADADPRQTNLERIVRARRTYAGDPPPADAPVEAASPADLAPTDAAADQAERDPLPRLPALPAAARAEPEPEPERSAHDTRPADPDPAPYRDADRPAAAEAPARAPVIYRSAGLSDIREAVAGMREALEGFASRRARANAVMEGELQRLQQGAAQNHLAEAVRLLAWLAERDRDVDEVLRAELRDHRG